MVLKRAVWALILLFFSACQALPYSQVQVPVPGEVDAEPTAALPPEQRQVLSICLGEEPASLFIYGDRSVPARIIRQAIYDLENPGPGGTAQPAVLLEIPSLENGQVTISEVEVAPGSRIVDARGNLTTLSVGTEYRPAGCEDPSCWEIFQDQETVLLEQLAVEFQVRPDLVWSDGAPLLAEDSVFSFRTAGLIYGGAGPFSHRYAKSYQTGDNGQVVWTGLPGFLGALSYADLFFSPLPEHIWGSLSREDLLTSAQTTRFPLGWGPYQVEEWIAGDHLTLLPNPSYHLAGDGLPAFDALVFRFVGTGEGALEALKAGECQILANQAAGLGSPSGYQAALQDGSFQLYQLASSAWEQISFGIGRLDGKTNLLENPEFRRTLAGCINREAISASRLDAGPALDGFELAAINDPENGGLIFIYQPVEAGLALKELGWIDSDGDPETPRIASGVPGIPDGTILQLELLTAGPAEPSATAARIRDDLQACGVSIELIQQPAGELLAPGPEGPVFGRNFELAYFAWASGTYHACRHFLTGEIPGLYPDFPRGWGGINAMGYSNPDFDDACIQRMTTPPDSSSNREAREQLVSIFQEDLPVLPLFFRHELAFVTPGLAGLESGDGEPFWSLEALRPGE